MPRSTKSSLNMDRQVIVGRPRCLPLPWGFHDMAWLAGCPDGILMIWSAIRSRLSATMSCNLRCPVRLSTSHRRKLLLGREARAPPLLGTNRLAYCRAPHFNRCFGACSLLYWQKNNSPVDIAAYWLKIAISAVVFGAPVRGETVRFMQQPLVTKTIESWAYQIVKEFRWYVQPFW